VTDPLFLGGDLTDLAEGDSYALSGPEGRHAAVVRRIGVGQTIVVADGDGRGVRAQVIRVDSAGLLVQVRQCLCAPANPVRFVVAQALAKGDRAELAAEMLTELGVDEIVPWRASRSVVRWNAERAPKALNRWRSTVREAAKQSRRLRIPTVAEPVDTDGLAARIRAGQLALVLHEEALEPIGSVTLPAVGEVVVVVGPEGGIGADEMSILQSAGGRPVCLGEGVLRTSTAGVVALAALKLR
jgi:16S rRNA (uracil1498-N3)-methyltransferase